MALKPPARKTITVDESILLGMALNKTFLAEFPFLSGLREVVKKTKGGCGSCGRSAATRSAAFSNIKQILATMDASKKRRLRELLNADAVKILYKDRSSHKLKELTIT